MKYQISYRNLGYQIKMIKKIKYCNKEVILKSYTTKQERDFLIFAGNLDELKLLLKDNIITNSELTDNEYIALIYMLRSISIGEEFDIKIKCSNCGKIFDVTENVSDMVTDSKLTEEYNNVISDNAQDFVNYDLDELEIQDYEKIISYINNNKAKLNFLRDHKCPYCKCDNKFNLNDFKLCVSSLSEEDISIFYETINKLVFYGHYDIRGIFEMYPYERILYIGLLTKEVEKVNKAKSQPR